MTSKTNAVVVFVTAPPADAQKIADSIIERRLAACVNINPSVQSVYHWQGKVERGEESLLIVKTTDAKFDELEAHIRNVHPYTCPEIIAMPVTQGYEGYLKWIVEETTGVAE